MFPERPSRVAILDVARGVALLAMASYHFTWDLSAFNYIAANTPETGGWRVYARCIATTFLFLVGVSLVLAHGRGVRWSGFWRRWAGIVAGAGAITALTWLAIRFGYLADGLIFFGILHEIAFASLAGLLFLRLPPLVTAAVAVLIVAASYVARSPIFDHWPLWWVGLSAVPPRSNDYVPVFPWLAPVLFGIAAARIAGRYGLFERLARLSPGPWSRPFSFIGRHSLAFYLIHQPVLIGCVFLASQIVPVSHERFIATQRVGCEAGCSRQSYDATFCRSYCGCLIEELDPDGRLAQSFPANDAERATLERTKAVCFATFSGAAPDEGVTP